MKESAKYTSDRFVGRWIAGQLSDQESEAFEYWLAAHPDQQERFDEMKEMWNSLERANLSASSPGGERWQRLQRRLQLTPDPTSRSWIAVHSWRLASIVVGALAVLGVYQLWQFRQYVEVESPRGSRTELNLPDGSAVWLNAESRLGYDKRTWGDRRDVRLEGEALFDVQRSPTPFSVSCGSVTARVLGTRFLVRSRGEVIEVACATGRVNVEVADRTKRSVMLTPGHGTRVIRGAPPEPPFIVNFEAEVAWSRGVLVFHQAGLAEVFRELGRQFDLEIKLEGSLLYGTFTGQVSLDDQAAALEQVCLSAGLQYRHIGRKGVRIVDK